MRGVMVNSRILFWQVNLLWHLGLCYKNKED